MSTWARPGVKVVCIRTASPEVRVTGAVYPEVGQVYTIRKIVVCTFGPTKGEPSLLLAEIANSPSINPLLFPEVPSDLEASMPIDAFRPLVTRTQEDDVALFRKIVADAPAGVDE